MKQQWKCLAVALALGVLTGCSTTHTASSENVIALSDQGSFSVGGTYVTYPGTFSYDNFLAPEGQKAYGDHAYVFYQKPVNARELPVVMQHGGAQTKRTWESTPDGRDGFQNLYLKDDFTVYLVDQPRMGEAGMSTESPHLNL